MGLRFLDMPRGLLPAAILIYIAFVFVALTALPARAQQAPDSYPGCQYVSSPGTLTSGQTSRFICTSGRLLKVETTPASGTTTDVNITKVGGNAVTTTLPVSGTVTANQGTANATPWTVTGSGTAGTAATGVLTVQGIASATPVLTVIAPSALAASGIATVKSSALESNHVIKSSAGNLYGWNVTTGATPGWILLYNGTSAPTAGGAAIAPEKCIYAPANATIGSSVGGGPPMRFSTGIVVVFSSSGCLTNTASATTFISGDAS